LQKSLDLLAHQTRSEALRAAIEEIRTRCAPERYFPRRLKPTVTFPRSYCATVRAGERSGSLDKVLAQYVSYQKQSRTFRKKFLFGFDLPRLSSGVSGLADWFL